MKRDRKGYKPKPTKKQVKVMIDAFAPPPKEDKDKKDGKDDTRD